MLLSAIWAVSVVLAAVATAVMAVLIVLRTINDPLSRRRARRRKALLDFLLSWLDGDVSDEAARTALLRQRDVSLALLIEIFELVRGENQQRLAALAEEAMLPGYMRETLVTGDQAERLAAAESLVWFPSPDGGDILRSALRDQSEAVSLAAAMSLAALGEKLPLGELLHRSLDFDGSRQLQAVLTRVAPHQAEDLLALARNEEARERVRAFAIEALAETGSFEMIDAVSDLRHSPSLEVRAAVARALGVFGHPGGGTAVTHLLHDPRWEVLAEATEAAGRLGLVSAAERLCELLNDEYWWVRFRSAEALTMLGENGTAILRRVASDNANSGGLIAALVLRERGLT